MRFVPPSVGDLLVFRRDQDGRVPVICQGGTSVVGVTNFVLFHTEFWLRTSAALGSDTNRKVLTDVSIVIRSPSPDDVYSHSYVIMWDGTVAYVDEDAVRDRFHILRCGSSSLLTRSVLSNG